VNRGTRHGGWRLRRYERLASTSDLCIQLAMAGEPEGLAVLAGQQSRGRGSRGRTWESPTGNLFLSVLLRPAGAAAAAGQYSLLAGIALLEALARFLPAPTGLSLKWPNDVLLGGKKIAGILIESATRADGTLAWLVIGLGANLAVAPAIPGRATACLADAAVAPPPPEDVTNAVLARLADWQVVQKCEGFAPVRAAWLARAHPLGTPLRVAGTGTARQGRFAGLAEDGALLLETDAGIEAIVGGEVMAGAGGAACCS
jgi:BirA family transcriptional regulator, biotin operon repressor / biotin---[acetyl-CoA-carboxylase] ligase